MLEIVIPDSEFYNSGTREFVTIKGQTLQLEHSLLSLSKWEAKWHKPFLTQDNKSRDELLSYYQCMTITKNVDPLVYSVIPLSEQKRIQVYINDPMTATTVKKPSHNSSRDVITSELIYFWMITLEIPFECEKWHLNRLLTLIQVCDIKNAPSKKMSKKDIFSQNRALNASRKARRR